MEHQQVHDPARSDRHASPIFVPSVKQGKLVRRGTRQRRLKYLAALGLIVLVLASFTYAFVVEHNREETLKKQAP